MQLANFITEIEAKMVNAGFEKIKDEDPEKFDQIIKLFNNVSEIAIHILRISPEFRAQFARIHAEFMKYPECREVIEGSINAYNLYKPEVLNN